MLEKQIKLEKDPEIKKLIEELHDAEE